MGDDPLPPTLDSTLFGPLSLSEIKIPGFCTFNYSAVWHPQNRAPVEVVFHPASQELAAWSQQLTQAEVRAQDILALEQSILLTGKKIFRRLFKSYSISPGHIEQTIPLLKLSMIQLLGTGNDELVYGSCQPFPSYDLIVEIDRDFRVTSGRFDG